MQLGFGGRKKCWCPAFPSKTRYEELRRKRTPSSYTILAVVEFPPSCTGTVIRGTVPTKIKQFLKIFFLHLPYTLTLILRDFELFFLNNFYQFCPFPWRLDPLRSSCHHSETRIIGTFYSSVHKSVTLFKLLLTKCFCIICARNMKTSGSSLI